MKTVLASGFTLVKYVYNKLTIKDTREDDDGAYVCQGANELGNVMGVIWIFVKDVGKLSKVKNDSILTLLLLLLLLLSRYKT